jgi:hypothetical protein
MRDSRLNDAEWRLQHSLSFSNVFSILLLAGAVAAFAWWTRGQPNRFPAPTRTVSITAVPFDRSGWQVDGGRISEGWQLSTIDRRFGGLSGLARDRGRFVALTDAGVIVRFDPPAGERDQLRGTIGDLPDGPGPPTLKSSRDSEALVADGKGDWWVAFEIHHWIWFYTRDFRRGFWSIDLEHRGFAPNKGIEGLVRLADGRLAAFPEEGGGYWLIDWRARRSRFVPVRGLGGNVSEAALLPDGRLIALRRSFSWRGMGLIVEQILSGPSGRTARPIARIATNGIVNFEGATAAPLPNGGTRLWMVSDDDFRPSGRTLLVALDLPPARASGTKG